MNGCGARGSDAWRGPRGDRGKSITSRVLPLSRATSRSGRSARAACWRDRTGSTTGGGEHDPEKWVPVFPRDKREAFARRSCSNKKIERDDDSKKSHRALCSIDGAAGPRWRRLLEVRRRRGCRGRRGGGGRRGMTFVALPDFVGELGLAAHRDVVVAIGEFGDDGTGNPGIGLRHQALQLLCAGGEAFAFTLKLLAIPKIVFGGIGERAGHAVAHIGAAGKRHAERKPRHQSGSARRRQAISGRSDHATL